MYKNLVFVLLLLLSINVHAAERESYYVDEWCHGKGATEYVLPDRTRVDCLTENFAIEFDWGYNWAESIGQSLYYGIMTERTPAVVLLLRDGEERFITRFETASQGLGIHLFVYYVD